MVKVSVMGASGYTGVELVRLLHAHPDVEIARVTARQNAGEEMASLFPSLFREIDLVCEEGDPARLAKESDIVFTALPHQTAMEVVPALLEHGTRVVDLSADYRLRDVDVYRDWYQEHTSAVADPRSMRALPQSDRTEKRVTKEGSY